MYFFLYGLYMLGGDIMFMCFYAFFFNFIFYVSYFTYGTLIIDLYYEVIHGICLFILCFVKTRSLFWFTCIFHMYVYVLFSVL